jgi:hypothetical protein
MATCTPASPCARTHARTRAFTRAARALRDDSAQVHRPYRLRPQKQRPTKSNPNHSLLSRFGNVGAANSAGIEARAAKHAQQSAPTCDAVIPVQTDGKSASHARRTHVARASHRRRRPSTRHTTPHRPRRPPLRHAAVAVRGAPARASCAPARSAAPRASRADPTPARTRRRRRSARGAGRSARAARRRRGGGRRRAARRPSEPAIPPERS